MFSLTRQDFKFVIAWFVLAISSLSAPSSVVAQGDSGSWSPPEWWMDPTAAENFRRQEKLKVTGLKSNNPNQDQIEGIKRLAHYYLSQLTFSENQSQIPKDVTLRLLGDLLNSSSRPGGRTVLMEEIIDRSKDLLQHPNPQVRTNMALMLIQLSSEPADFQSRTPAVPFNPVYKTLIEILNDSSQILEVRIVAANGLIRVLRDGKNAPSSTERSDIANALAGQLEANPPSPEPGLEWFRRRMIQALGFAGRIDNTQGQPIVINTLMNVVRNKSETWVNRAEACQSLSQLPFTSSVNVELVTYEICRFLEAMVNSQGFMKSPTSNVWNQAFSRVYLSFRPATQADANDRNFGLLYQVRRPGLGGQETYVKAAFEKALPVISPILTTTSGVPPLSKQTLTTFTTWLAENPPSNRTLTTGGMEIPN